MSQGTFGKSGEKILKNAIGQFKGIILQIREGVRKVALKVTANTKKTKKLEDETLKKTNELKKDSDRMVKAVEEAEIVMANLQAILSGKILVSTTEKTTEPVDEAKEETPSKS